MYSFKKIFQQFSLFLNLAVLSFLYLPGYSFEIYSMESTTRSIPPELNNLPYAVYPDSPNYDEEKTNYNKRFVYFPLAIFIPTNNQEIQFVLSALISHNLDFAIRSGRHCFEPCSLSMDYIIDVSNFNKIIPDFIKNEVFIGAGSRLGDVISTLGATNHAIPTGTCPGVGIGGLALGGGIGYLCRTFGLTCDAVKSITLLNADTQIIEVDATHFEDLFWALRGAGNGSFGIILGFTFFMQYIPDASFYELAWEWDPKIFRSIMVAWQEWIQTLSPQISSVLAVSHPNAMGPEPHNIAPPQVIRITGLKIGPEPFTEWQQAFLNLNPHVNIIQGGYGDLSKFWVGQSSLPFVKSKSRILMKPIRENTVSLINSLFEKLDGQEPDLFVNFEFEAFGGAVPLNHTAFFPRRAIGWWHQAYQWAKREQSAEILALSCKFYDEIPNDVSKCVYSNSVDYDIGPCFLNLYYGNHVKPLIKIKRKYDPTNLFHWCQSIPLECCETDL